MFWEFVQSLFAMFWNYIYYKLRLYCQFPLAIHCYIVTLQQWCINNLYRFSYLSEPFSKFFPLHLINRRGDTWVVKLYWRFSLSWVIQRFVRGRSLISDSYLKGKRHHKYCIQRTIARNTPKTRIISVKTKHCMFRCDSASLLLLTIKPIGILLWFII